MAILQFRNMGTATVGSGPFYNIMHVSCPDGAEQATVDGVTGLLETFYTNMKGTSPGGMTWYPAERVTSVSEPPVIYIPSSPAAPVVAPAGSSAAPQLSMCISWRTNKAGSRYRGRTYYGPLTPAAIGSDGKFTPSAVSSALGYAQTFLTAIPGLDIGGGAAFLGVYSRKYGTIEAITGVTIDSKIDTQRRRN